MYDPAGVKRMLVDVFAYPSGLYLDSRGAMTAEGYELMAQGPREVEVEWDHFLRVCEVVERLAAELPEAEWRAVRDWFGVEGEIRTGSEQLAKRMIRGVARLRHPHKIEKLRENVRCRYAEPSRP